MAASNGEWVPTSDERFWSTVWPQLKSGGWRIEVQPIRPPRAVQAGGGRRNSAEGSTATVYDLNGSNSNNSDGSGSSSGVNGEDGDSPRSCLYSDDLEVETAEVPVFFPPALGVASEALEEAMRRNLPADGSAGEERLDRLEGVEAVVELLTQVPGFPGTTSFGAAPSMDAVAAAARAVLVRTPSPKQPAAAAGAAVPVAKRAEPPPHAKSVATPSTATASSCGSPVRNPGAPVGAHPSSPPPPMSRNSSCSSSSDGEPSAKKPRPVGIRGGTRSSTASIPTDVLPPSSTENAPSSSGVVPNASNGGGSEGAVAGAGIGACTTPSTRLGRVIKKPVRLEEQPPCRQSLSGRSVRSDAPAKLKTREEPVRTAATPTTPAALPASAATAKVCDKASETAVKTGEEHRDVGAGAERCVARLGTAVVPDAETDRLLGSSGDGDKTHGSAGKVGVGATRISTRGGKRDVGTIDRAASNDNNSNSSSSRNGGVVGSRRATAGAGLSAGSVVRTALPAARRTAGVVLASSRAVAAGGDTEEGSGGVEIAMDAGAGGGKEVGVGRAATPEWPPVRPVGGLGENPDETVKEYKRACDDVIWPSLAKDFGWSKILGPRVSDAYYMPKGVVRGQNGAKCRVDFYDSFRQVVVHMVSNESKYRGLLDKAWATATAKPRPATAMARLRQPKSSGRTPAQKRRRRWTETARRANSAMGASEYPKKVSLVGPAHQVDPSNLPTPVSSEEYTPPEDLPFEQVWAPLPATENGRRDQHLDALVKDFSSVVSHDKCLEIVYRCDGDYAEARTMLTHLLRLWKSKYSGAVAATRETATARAIVVRETSARLASAAASTAGVASALTPTATRSAVAWGGGAGAGVNAGGSGCNINGKGGDVFWCLPLRNLAGGEAALKRGVEGGISGRPPGARNRDELARDLNLTRPWSAVEAQTFTRELLEEGSKNFYAVQKALPDRQVCELVDRYYGGWKQTGEYKTLKESIRIAKVQSACWECQTGGDLICCDECDGVYHFECVNLPCVPEGDWYCADCAIKRMKNGAGRDNGQPSSSSSTSAFVPVSNGNATVLRDLTLEGAGLGGSSAPKNKRGQPPAGGSAAGCAAAAPTSKRQRAVQGRAGGGQKPSASVRGGGSSSARGLERVPIQFGNMRVAGGETKPSPAAAVAPAGAATNGKSRARPAKRAGGKDGGSPDSSGTRTAAVGGARTAKRLALAPSQGRQAVERRAAVDVRNAQSGAGVEGLDAGWTCCRCMNPNRGGQYHCYRCGNPHPARVAGSTSPRSNSPVIGIGAFGAGTSAMLTASETARVLKAGGVLAASVTAGSAAPSRAGAAGRSPPSASATPAKSGPVSSTLWACTACTTLNKAFRTFCFKCETAKQIQPTEVKVEAGGTEWWCCSACSRFNSSLNDGNTCRICTAPRGAEVEEDDDEEISVGLPDDGVSLSIPPAAAARFAVRLPPA